MATDRTDTDTSGPGGSDPATPGSRELPRTGIGRAARMASIPLGIGGRAVTGAGRRLLGADRETVARENTERTAEQIMEVLGELKGGAMKVGQALSIFAGALPEDTAEPMQRALTKLQAEAPPMPKRQVHRVLDAQLGTDWRRRFRHFEEDPVAAASIGQVHRAVWSNGSEVAVKVQYPGADAAIKSDLRQLRRLTPLLGRLDPGTDMAAVIAEIGDSVTEELDYRIEADHQRAFHTAFGYGDGPEPSVLVPRVYASAPKVLVTQWVSGRRLSEIIDHGTMAERSATAEALTVFEFASASLARRMHTDPHPGNFLVLEDGRMAVIDFGACIRLPEGLPPELVQMVQLALAGDGDRIREVALATGYIDPRRADDITGEQIIALLAPFAEPLAVDDFVFSRAWMREVAEPFGPGAIGGEVRTLTRNLGLPSEYVLIHRVLAGAVAVLCQLGAPAPYRQVIRRYYPDMVADS